MTMMKRDDKIRQHLSRALVPGISRRASPYFIMTEWSVLTFDLLIHPCSERVLNHMFLPSLGANYEMSESFLALQRSQQSTSPSGVGERSDE